MTVLLLGSIVKLPIAPSGLLRSLRRVGAAAGAGVVRCVRVSLHTEGITFLLLSRFYI